MTGDPSSQTLQLLQQRLMALPGVAAVGETRLEGRVCLKVYFVDAASSAAAQLPAELDAVPIVSVVCGSFEAGID